MTFNQLSKSYTFQLSKISSVDSVKFNHNQALIVIAVNAISVRLKGYIQA